MVETAIARNLEFGTNTETRASRFGQLDRGKNTITVAVEVKRPLVERACRDGAAWDVKWEVHAGQNVSRSTRNDRGSRRRKASAYIGRPILLGYGRARRECEREAKEGQSRDDGGERKR